MIRSVCLPRVTCNSIFDVEKLNTFSLHNLVLNANKGPQKLDNRDKLQKSIKCEHFYLLVWIGHPGLQICHMFVWSQHKPHFLRRSTTRGTQWVNRNFPFCGWQSSKVHFSRGNSEWRMEWKERKMNVWQNGAWRHRLRAKERISDSEILLG